MDPREARARDIQATIRRVLLREWDPIGVQDAPQAQDEYDGYVGGVYRLLANGASARELAEHLARVERDSMGLSTAAEARIGVADRLKRSAREVRRGGNECSPPPLAPSVQRARRTT